MGVGKPSRAETRQKRSYKTSGGTCKAQYGCKCSINCCETLKRAEDDPKRKQLLGRGCGEGVMGTTKHRIQHPRVKLRGEEGGRSSYF